MIHVRTIGVLGGGQLGRMLTLEAKRMGYRVVTLEPFPDSPCGQVADEQIVAAYDDARAVGELGARSDVITYEFENIPLESALLLERDGRMVRPNSEALRITQDRLLEKTFLREARCPTVEFAPIRKPEELDVALADVGLPAVFKTVRGGYDGKGQWLVRSFHEAAAAVEDARGQALICERFVEFDREVSLISSRGADGHTVRFPVTENVHDTGVLVTTIVPARVSAVIEEKVCEAARRIGDGLGIVGTYCVEFFVVGQDVYVNEIAPRVHNSGHFSLDATQISQYEAHVRAICDLPLVEPRLFAPAVMMNILGDGAGDDLAGIDDVLRDPDLKLHLYGKRHAALRRKMGHFTVLGRTTEDALDRATRAKAALSWTPPLRTKAIAVALES
ncbi:MAG: 5-(carboxyamino)imidazole ribonucleotide synthase [Candidatus Eremiobacteraeota bacterium]|nr:5-(carboxyamino)imidazole ribonucleotide synthase [Candidatus Eremiobacteraeota bacterium]